MVTLYDADGNEVEVDLPDPEQTPPAKVTPQWRKDLEEQARQGKEALKKLADFERAKAISDAGIDTKNPVSSLFLETYKGELTPEAIKAEAAKYGLIAAAEQDPTQPDPQELQQFETFDQTGAYSRNPTAWDQANDAFQGTSPFVRNGSKMEWNYEGPQKILDIYAQATGGAISQDQIQGKVLLPGSNQPPFNPGESAWPAGV